MHVDKARQRSAADWTALLEQHLQAAQDTLSAASQQRSASAFCTLLEGKRGTSGIYGLWQRTRERLLGHSYEPDHMVASRSTPPRSTR